MGRITIFTADDCEASQTVTEALIKIDVKFTEINLSIHRKRRRDMIELSQSLYTPQIFFNSEHVGGSKEFLDLMNSWEDETTNSAYGSVRERIQSEVLDDESPDIILLRRPKPQTESDNPPNNKDEEINEILLPNGSTSDVCKMTVLLMKHLSKSTSFHKTKSVSDRFSGKLLVQTLKKLGIASTDEEAMDFSQTLQNLQVFHSASKSQTFDIKSNSYRLQPFLVPNVMNSFCFWISYTGSGKIVENPLKVISDLSKMLGRAIEVEKTGAFAENHDCEIFNEPTFNYFEQQVCKLQLIDIGTMDTRTRVAFFINLYNLMTAHGKRRLGVEKLSPDYQSKLKYNVGGYLLSLNDIHHGILRANNPYSEKQIIQFPPFDVRYKLILPGNDKRIHFVLDRGEGTVAGSYQFTREAVELELQHVCEMFCAQDANVHVDPYANKLTLPSFLKTYVSDFTKSSSIQKLPKSICGFLKDEKLKTLKDMIESSKSLEKEIKIKFHEPVILDCCQPEKLNATANGNTVYIDDANEKAPLQFSTPNRKSSKGNPLKLAKNFSSKKLKGFLHIDRNGSARKEPKNLSTQIETASPSTSHNNSEDDSDKAQGFLYPDKIEIHSPERILTETSSTKEDDLDNKSPSENYLKERVELNCTTIAGTENYIKPTHFGEKVIRKIGSPSERTLTTEEETLDHTSKNILNLTPYNNTPNKHDFSLDLDICPTNHSVITSGSGVTFSETSSRSGDIVTRLSNLANLKNIGALTDAEFQAAKAIVIAESSIPVKSSCDSASNEFTSQITHCSTNRILDELSEVSYGSKSHAISDNEKSEYKLPAKVCLSEKTQPVGEGKPLTSDVRGNSTTSSETCADQAENSIQDASSSYYEDSSSSFDAFSIDDDDKSITDMVGDATNALFDDIFETNAQSSKTGSICEVQSSETGSICEVQSSETGSICEVQSSETGSICEV